MKKVFLIIMVLIIFFTFSGCVTILEDTDDKFADNCINNICNAIKDGNHETVKKLFSNKACSDANDINSQIDELFGFVNDEPISWNREESPVVEDFFESKNTKKHQMFWFSMKTSKEAYSVFLSYYPIDNMNPNNEGIYSMLVIRECDENNLEGSMNVWAEIPGIKIYK